MKNRLVMLLFLTTCTCGFSQEFKRISTAFGSGVTSGALIFIEPTYKLNSKVALGLRLEAAMVNYESFGYTAIASAAGIMKYYFIKNSSTKKTRPYAGLGVGYYYTFEIVDFGFCPHIGMEYNRFSFQVDLNLMTDTKVDFTKRGALLPINYVIVYTDPSYASFKVGYRVGLHEK